MKFSCPHGQLGNSNLTEIELITMTDKLRFGGGGGGRRWGDVTRAARASCKSASKPKWRNRCKRVHASSTKRAKQESWPGDIDLQVSNVHRPEGSKWQTFHWR